MTQQRPDVDAILGRLKDFQRATAHAVTARMFDDEAPQRRFLVADEVGLGKTKIARAVVAETVNRLWDDPDVERIDVVYLCSNAQIARQNVRDLDVVGAGTDDRLADRITLLPRALRGLRDRKVNLVAFTPGTSLTLGQSTGTVDERALLFVLLARVWGRQLLRREGARLLMQARPLKAETWDREVQRAETSDLDQVVGPFGEQLTDALRMEFEHLADGRRWRHPTPELRRRARRLVIDLRQALARACIALLTPDLVVLDEFQRFPDLLDADDDDEQAALARLLFAQPGVRVLLLSATPYRMLTRQERDGEDHFADFARTTRFLFDGGPTEGDVDALTEHLNAVRLGLDRGEPAAELVGHQRAVETMLRQVMVRTERLAASADRDGMLHAEPAPASLSSADVASFRRVDAIAQRLGAPGIVEYWKSAPYLLEFMEGYALDRALEVQVDRDPDLQARLGDTGRSLTAEVVRSYGALEPDNGRLRWLIDDLDRHRAFDLPWLPPALPETQPAGVFADPHAQAFTKRLVFSGWTVVPRALACLLSYEAERRHPSAATHAERKVADGLAFRRVRDRPASFPVLALLWPGDGLAALGNPLRHVRQNSRLSLPLDVDELRALVSAAIRGELAPLLGRVVGGREDFRWYVVAARALDRHDSVVTAERRRPWASSADDGDGYGALDDHVAELLDLSPEDLGAPPEDLLDVLTDIAIAGPGPAARRGVDRVASSKSWRVPGPRRVEAAARLAWALRSILIGPEVAALIGGAGGGDDAAFWRSALRYCVDGALGSVVHEYLHLLPDQQRLDQMSHGDAMSTVVDAAEEAMRAPATSLTVRDWRSAAEPTFAMRQHFAVRFGQNGGREEHPARVRASFNSPFRPFVLVSTSVGQEGLDFHHYAHAVVHWNLPSNPVDLEQREGRVHRYKNHAVRKNLGRRYGGTREMIIGTDPWESMFEAAAAAREPGRSEITPWWVFPGEAKIQRLVPVLPMSRDVGRLRELVAGARRYRMAFGQPRQSELLASLADRYGAEELDELADLLTIDLSPGPLKGLCPECEKRAVVEIVYGMPTYEAFQDAERGHFELGGCAICPDAPTWACRSCGARGGVLMPADG